MSPTFANAVQQTAERDRRGGPLRLPSAQEEDDSQKRKSVEREGSERTGKGDHQSAERWADGARDVESDRVQCDAGGEARRTHHVGSDGLPRRIVDDGTESEKKCE